MMRYFDHLGHGVLLTTPAGWICAANARANSILAETVVLRNADGQIEAVLPAARQRLSEAIFRTGSAEWNPDAVWLPLHGAGEPPLLATVPPVRNEGEAALSSDTPTAAVYLSCPGSSGMPLPTGPLQAMFGFTLAEARVACHLASGASLMEAAEALGVSHNTVRTHLQRAMSKAGVSRRRSWWR